MDEALPVEPKVSAVIISHNTESDLRRCVAALEASKDRERLEILVVDCGSTDNSAQIDTEFPGVTVMRLPHHFGATRAMNIGTRTAKGEYVLYLDPSIEFTPGTAKDLAHRLDSDLEVIAATPLIVNPQDRPVSRILRLPTPLGEPSETPPEAPKEPIVIEFAGREALMVRRQFVKGMNFFDARYGHWGADADLAMQIRRAQKKIRLYPEIRAIRHPSAAQELDDRFATDRELGQAAFLGKYYGFGASLKYRLKAVLRALFGFQIGRLSSLITGRKVDHADPA